MAKNSSVLINIGQGMSIMAGLPTINAWDEDKRPKNPKPGTIGFNTTSISGVNLQSQIATILGSFPITGYQFYVVQ
jgi:hypothetical protein